ncbi:MAG: STAS domain-containing protein [Candidatus Muiribacteriota bacterium]
MILKLVDELKEEDVLAKEVTQRDSILYKSGKVISEDVIKKIKSLGIGFVYIEGKPGKDELIRQYKIELENSLQTSISDDEKITFLIKEKVSAEDIFSFYEKINDINVKKNYIDYCFKDFSDNIFNFFLKKIRHGIEPEIVLYILDYLEKNIKNINAESIITLYKNSNAEVVEKVKNILKNNYSLRQLYDLKKRLELKNEKYDFFDKDVNFNLMPHKSFWDIRIMVVSKNTVEHNILKSYLENLEMNVKYCEPDKAYDLISSFDPYIIFFDFDRIKNPLNKFLSVSNEFYKKIFFIISSSADIKLLKKTMRAGADYFLKKPYSLPKIQTYLSKAVKNGKLIEQLDLSNNLLKVDIRYFGYKIKKFDFYGELSAMTTDEINEPVLNNIQIDKFYFFDMQNLDSIDMSGVRFLLKVKDVVKQKTAELYLLNCSDKILEQMGNYSNHVNIVESWEKAIWV